MRIENDVWKSGIWGFVAGDALGVPLEFESREEVKSKNISGMTGHGTYDMPAGTWSDDSSMTLAALDSIRKKNGCDFKDIMDKFLSWYKDGEYTPAGIMFDIGVGTERALRCYSITHEVKNCGSADEHNNGNGSLMRILPVCLYLQERQKSVCMSEDESIYIIHSVSALTHGHLRSQIACGIYYFLVKAVLNGNGSLKERLQTGMDESFFYYRSFPENYRELMHYSRLTDLNKFSNLPEEEIKSSGYVVDTLEAVVWCLLNTVSYKDAVLKAVNLGGDTDTIGAITGGLAGLYYGSDFIPAEWMDAIQNKELINEILLG